MFHKIIQKNIRAVTHFISTVFHRNLISSIKKNPNKSKHLVQKTLITLDIEENLLKKTRSKLLYLKFKLYLLISEGVAITVFLNPMPAISNLQTISFLIPLKAIGENKKPNWI